MASPQNPPRVVGEKKAVTQSNLPKDSHTPVDVEHRFPCTTILIHGVNDLGTDFGTVEGGLCEGLGDRLGRDDLVGAEYFHGRMANDPKKVTTADLMQNLDDVMYRRIENDKTRSPLIPFYWGVREDKTTLPKEKKDEKVNGQYVDIFGNRLDSHRAKNGGFFANATTNIPDMFGTHFIGGWKTGALNAMQGDPTHPLYEAPDRHYMVLAAVRLATLIRQIRIINPDETVNIIAHSQGTMISLLAQAFLINGLDPKTCSVGDRPADTLILIDSPYSIEQETMERWTQSGDEQQTTYARAKTLANLTQLVAQAKHTQPSLDQLSAVDESGKVVRDNHGIAGPKWGPWPKATRLKGPKVIGNAVIAFAERDNRGKVYLYFSPEDLTVGLKGVNGMGSEGLPDSKDVTQAKAGAKKESVRLLTPSFLQRIFTRRVRNGMPVLVGGHPGPFTIRTKGETAHGSGWYDSQKRADIPEGTVRTINGEPLPPPFPPEMEGNVISGTETKPLNSNEHEPGMQSIDQLDAEIALSTNSGDGALREVAQQVAWPDFQIGGLVPDNRDVEKVLNAKKDSDSQCQVLQVRPVFPPRDGQLMVRRTETLNEAKVRLMNEHSSPSSYHSAVMSGRRNHRCATAFDVAIGQGRAVDDPQWAKLLRAIADWRIDLGSIQNKYGKGKYSQLDPLTCKIVEANCQYYYDGTFPSDLVPKTPPPQVVSEIYQQQQDFKRKQEAEQERKRIDERNQRLKAQAEQVKSQVQQGMARGQQYLGNQVDAAKQGLDGAFENAKQGVKDLWNKF
ncbi:DUF3274 domain-containing protein [Burkholderia cepacia]|uniref:T6SS effector phospholipase Tle3 domain-containing protein n=1 Tax=Burkholderia cepacia TaxID=292 RepID=UPI00075218A1|nr:DUF3274 domain-containing protein [Burkholderia cepacia]KVA63919.1 hypothetical protein WI48_07695 [Burkholderia cepacia]KVA77236.1 hypothetical protein WI50_34940 [Burkholderia cepacia]KVA87010.1 hypothetical protein WI52_12635 [Burkholderia cepacia]KVA89080.1 hypothetical protein WI51_14415 [Burkholderia cepacia]KVB01316.1 hypothetical protein WI54_28740 [Burkholderia cepacia]